MGWLSSVKRTPFALDTCYFGIVIHTNNTFLDKRLVRHPGLLYRAHTQSFRLNDLSPSVCLSDLFSCAMTMLVNTVGCACVHWHGYECLRKVCGPLYVVHTAHTDRPETGRRMVVVTAAAGAVVAWLRPNTTCNAAAVVAATVSGVRWIILCCAAR